MATSLYETVQAKPLAPWPLLGQERPVALLQGAIARDGVSHAYLFVGAAQSGRATLARAFAQTLNCETAPTSGGPPLAPCGLCRSCRKIERGLHPDVRVVGLATQEATSAKNRRESKNTSLSIDTIRDLCADLSLRPLEGRWRVAIVEDAETMREDAANAFLKTLEEPPPFAVLILLMPDAGATLTTIRSRCQVIETQPVSREALAQTLTARYNVSPAQARTLAALARGRVGWAIAASAQPDFFAGRQAAFDTMLGLLQGPAYDFFPAVDHWVDQFKRGRRDEVFADLDAWLGLWRDLLLMRSGCADLILNVDYADQLQAQAARYTLDRLRDAIAATRDGVRWLDENVAPRTALEAMVLRWQEDR
ncbi:MAG: DNA polymerase III subunit delta' [Thermomicrobiales bacterium]